MEKHEWLAYKLLWVEQVDLVTNKIQTFILESLGGYWSSARKFGFYSGFDFEIYVGVNEAIPYCKTLLISRIASGNAGHYRLTFGM